MADTARATARVLIETESVLFRPDDPFTFTSGKKSPVYVDCRRLISFPDARRELMVMMTDLVRKAIGLEEVDVIAGGETAGIPFAAWVAARLDLPMVYIRKEAKGFGRNARIEGVLEDGPRVLLVEDLATDGGSKLSFVEGVREAGGLCAHTVVIFHYGIFPDGIAALEAAGVQLHELANWWDVVACAEAEDYFDTDTLATVRAYLEAPDDWQAAHT